jgi:hypothetical protein
LNVSFPFDIIVASCFVFVVCILIPDCLRFVCELFEKC